MAEAQVAKLFGSFDLRETERQAVRRCKGERGERSQDKQVTPEPLMANK